mgnify:CR=1 FL=1
MPQALTPARQQQLQALAARHGVASGEVCVGAGADGCLDLLSQALLDPGDEIVCGWPSFPSYVIYARKQGATAQLVPLREHRYDLDAIAGAIVEIVDAVEERGAGREAGGGAAGRTQEQRMDGLPLGLRGGGSANYNFPVEAEPIWGEVLQRLQN